MGSEGQSFNCTSVCSEALWNCEESSGGDRKKPGTDADRADESRCISQTNRKLQSATKMLIRGSKSFGIFFFHIYIFVRVFNFPKY